MSDLLSKLLGKSKKKVETNKEAQLAKIKEELMKLVYDDELVTEYAPIFERMSQIEGFDKVMELITTKEKQIEAISGGNWFTKESSAEEDEEEEVNLNQKEEQSSSDPLIALIEKRNKPSEK